MNRKKSKVITHEDFYKHKDWKRCREIILKANKAQCLKCGSISNINIDHIKPKTKYPILSFDLFNLQTLCSTCNKDKYLKENDYRTEEYILNLTRYIKDNKINRKALKYKNKISKFIFVHTTKMKQVRKKIRKRRKNKEKRKLSKRDELDKSLRSSGFKDPSLDISKILELQGFN